MRNVSKLEVAWVYRAGGADPNNRSQIQCNPLVIGGVLYGTTPDLQLFAVEAATGRELWRFDPASIPGITKTGVNRGLAYWSGGGARRILYANDHFLHSIDAATGRRVPDFGEGGSIDLKRDLDRDASNLALQCTTPGVVFGDLLIMGMRLGEGPALKVRGVPATGTENYGGPVVTDGGLVFIAASRDERIRAFDRRTGAELWSASLPAGGYATPATYAVKARQFVVIACGGGKIGTRSGDAYVAFALPLRAGR